jgi:hypothetical protein
MSVTPRLIPMTGLAGCIALVAFGACPVRAAVPDDLRAAMALQLALDRVGFSPGLIDGIIGPKTRTALEAFQRSRGLKPTGQLTAETRAALKVDEPGATTTYTITKADARQIGPAPRDWTARSRLDRLAYPSLDELVAERFHCHRRLLGTLNPGVRLDRLAVGSRLIVPNVDRTRPPARAERLVVDVARKIIEARTADGRVCGLFHCSVAAKEAKLPRGTAHVAVIAENPVYLFDPEKWPEVKGVDRKLTIPPGPRNPVGVRWIGLSLPGVGIHGTPSPELIGKTGSHGCIRLTNWDAVRLASMVRVGTPVTFVGADAVARAR